MFQSGGISILPQGTAWQDQGFSRENVATVIADLAELSGTSVTGDLSKLSHFTDIDSLSDSQKMDIPKVLELGVMSGTSSTKFGTGQMLNRGSACVIIHKMLHIGLLSAKEADTSYNITITGKVLDFKDNQLYVEDTTGTLHTIYKRGRLFWWNCGFDLQQQRYCFLSTNFPRGNVITAYLQAWAWGK